MPARGFVISASHEARIRCQSGGSEQHYAHVRDFIECVKTRGTCRSNFETAHRSTTAPNLGNIAYWTGRKLKYDAKSFTFPGDAEANKHIFRPYRKPWDLVKLS